MKNKLTARDPLIYHAKVPDILIAEMDKRDTNAIRRTEAEAKQVEPPPVKKQKQSKPISVHPLLLKHFINGVWKQNPALQMRDLCKHCNCTIPSIVKDITACLLFFFGKCRNPNCNKQHRATSTEEAQHVVCDDALENAIKNPEEINRINSSM